MSEHIFTGRNEMQTNDGRVVPVEIVRSMDDASMKGRSQLTGEDLPGREERNWNDLGPLADAVAEGIAGGEITINGLPVDQGMVRRSRPVKDEMPNMAMEYNPQKWIEEKLAFWQRQLRLQDWDLTVERSNQLETGGKSATTWMDAGSKEGRIRIWKREEWMGESQRYGTWDEELFLVHELIHLHLWAWKGADDAGDPNHEEKEAAIDLMAQALVRMSRGEFR